MSGDVQPRKRKEKRRKKEDSEEIPSSFSSDEQLHVHKDASTGGNICAKILFFLLSFVLLVMIGLVVLEYRGSSDDESLVPVSKWASTFDGWLETPVKHDEHADVTESGEQEHGESGEHETESAEGEEHLSEEATSKEDEEEEGKESEEEETKSAEEEEYEDEESDKLEDEGSEEVDENESEEIEDKDDDDGEDEEQEGSDEDVYERTKSEEDLEGEEDGTEEDDYEEEDAESGRDEPDEEEEEEEEEEGEAPAYGRESDEIDDVLSEIPGITESDEDEEGDDLGRSDEVIDKLQKIPGVHEKKIKATSEEADQPRRKQEKEVSGSTQPVEGTTTVKVGQKPHEKHRNQDQDKSKGKAHQSAVKQKDVTEKPIVAKHEKPKAILPQEELASKSSDRVHSDDHPAMKNDGFPSEPGETAKSQKAEDPSVSKVTPSKKQKVDVKATKDGSSENTLPKKQNGDTGPALKSERIAVDHARPIVSRGKNFKDKDVSSDGVHSAPKPSQTGDKLEHLPNGGKSSTLHKSTEQSSQTKLDANDRVSVSKSPHIDKSAEKHTKPINSKDKQGTKSVHSGSDKNIKIDTNDVQTTADNRIKRSDLKADVHAKLETARKLPSVDKAVNTVSNGKGKENAGVEPQVKETENLNSQTKQVKGSHSTSEKKLAGKKVENLHKNEGNPSNQEKKNVEQLAPKFDHHAETVHRVDAKDSSAAKVHGDSKKLKADIEKQKAGSSSRAETSDEVSNEVPLKVSTDKAKKLSTYGNTETRTSEKSDNVNTARKKSSVGNTPPNSKHNSKASDTKATAETTLKHSVRKDDDSSMTQEVKSNVKNVANGKNTQEEELKLPSASETRADHQESSGNNKPVSPSIKKPSHGQKVSPQRMENEVTQSKSERPSREKAAPSRRNSISETVK